MNKCYLQQHSASTSSQYRCRGSCAPVKLPLPWQHVRACYMPVVLSKWLLIPLCADYPPACVVQGAAELVPFDPFGAQPKMSYKDGYQKRYFVLDSFEVGVGVRCGNEEGRCCVCLCVALLMKVCCQIQAVACCALRDRGRQATRPSKIHCALLTVCVLCVRLCAVFFAGGPATAA